MRYLFNYIFIVVCLLLVSACNKRLDNYDLAYSGDRLVVFGNISNEDGVAVYLTHTLPPTGTYYLDDIVVNVSGAVITLSENNILMDTLEESEPGFYVASFLPTPGNNYSIQIIASGFETVYSSIVTYPEPIILDGINYETGFEDESGDPAFSLKPNFTDNSSLDNYYAFGFSMFIGDEIASGNIYETPDSGPLGCEAGVITYETSTIKIYSDNCFSGTTFPFSFISSKVYHETEIIPFDKCEFTVSAVSKELVDYVANQSETAGIQLLFSDPKLNYTNITNGFGVFWAQSDTTFVYHF